MLYFTIAALVVVLDQASKLIIRHTFLSNGERIVVVDNVLNITRSENTGAVLGLLSNARPVLITVTIAAIFALVFFAYRMRYAPLLKRVCLGLILGGAFGNLIDRLTTGRVIDFIDMGIGPYRWPVYNIADIAVTVGAVVLIYGFLRHPHDDDLGNGIAPANDVS